MVSVTFVVCTSEPLVPVIVMACGPVAAPAGVVPVRVAEPLAAMGLGAKPKVTPLMAGAAESVTLLAKPLSAVSVTVKLAGLPAVTLAEPGLAASEKSGAGAPDVPL